MKLIGVRLSSTFICLYLFLGVGWVNREDLSENFHAQVGDQFMTFQKYEGKIKFCDCLYNGSLL